MERLRINKEAELLLANLAAIYLRSTFTEVVNKALESSFERWLYLIQGCSLAERCGCLLHNYYFGGL